MKYVIMEQKVLEYHYPVIFPDDIVHKSIVDGFNAKEYHCIGAGFVHLRNGFYHASGESESLHISADQQRDSMLISLFLLRGLAGMALANHLLMLELQLSPKEHGKLRAGMMEIQGEGEDGAPRILRISDDQCDHKWDSATRCCSKCGIPVPSPRGP